jgi:hypothetical protein
MPQFSRWGSVRYIPQSKRLDHCFKNYHLRFSGDIMLSFGTESWWGGNVKKLTLQFNFRAMPPTITESPYPCAWWQIAKNCIVLIYILDKPRNWDVNQYTHSCPFLPNTQFALPALYDSFFNTHDILYSDKATGWIVCGSKLGKGSAVQFSFPKPSDWFWGPNSLSVCRYCGFFQGLKRPLTCMLRITRAITLLPLQFYDLNFVSSVKSSASECFTTVSSRLKIRVCSISS